MTPHLHSRYVEGCYRCELSLDEVEGSEAPEEVEHLGYGLLAPRQEDDTDKGARQVRADGE